MSEQFHILGQIHAILEAILFLEKKRNELQEKLDELEKKDMDKIVKPKLSVMGYNKNDIEPTN
jgi:hypothetical protein